jgi:hypothetical protein
MPGTTTLLLMGLEGGPRPPARRAGLEGDEKLLSAMI